MEYNQALTIAQRVLEELRPHCLRCEIAGSIRRAKPEVKDIEIVAIPKPYNTGLFADGIATVVEQWRKVKGELPCKYTQRILPEGIKLDLFFAEPGNWGLILAIRTGSADYSHNILADRWVKRGYHSIDGYIHKNGVKIETPEEADVFALCDLPWTLPIYRTVNGK